MYNHGQKDQYYIKNGHPAIIDRTTWDAVQNKFKDMGEKYHVHSYARQNMASKRVRYEFNGWIPCPYCGKYYLVKTNHYNGQPSKKHLMCYSNHKTKLCKSENYPLDVFKEILAKQIKILKSNIPSFKELLINEFNKVKEEPISNEIESLNSQIESLRNKYNDIKDYHDDYFISLQEETMNQINKLVTQRSILQNKENSMDVNTRVKQIIDSLKALPNEIEDVEAINFKSVFSKAVIVNKGLIYFMVGNEDIKNLPLRPDLYFKSSIEYKVRKSVFTTQFGIIVF